MSNATIHDGEVRRWVKLLRSKAQEDRLRAALQLGRIGVRTRGGTMTRGSLSSPAAARMPQEQLKVALQALSDADPKVREEVAFALGEWADDIAVTVLGRLAKEDAYWPVRAAAVDALGKIGGSQAVEVLEDIALKDVHEDVRARAVGGLAALAKATGETLLGERFTPTRTAIRTRGAVRTGTPSPVRKVSPEAARILDLLRDIRAGDSSDLVRTMADGALADLGE